MNLSNCQSNFLDLALRQRKNIFLTGKAGTGKSTVTKILMEYFEKEDVKYVALAPTGIAANNIKGQTIHSLFQISPYGIANFETCSFVKSEKRKLYQSIQTVIIDEVSMLRPDILDAINYTFLKNGCGKLSDRQVIFIGDLKQLPPVLKDNERSVLYETYDGDKFFNAKCYSSLNIHEVNLEEVLRQSDNDFIAALNEIREGRKSEYFRNFVRDSPAGIVLAPHNTTAQRYNKAGLDALKTEEFVFDAQLDGKAKFEDFNLEAQVRVKNGAKIMYLVNSKEHNDLINGTIGTFVSHQGCHYIRVNNVDYALHMVTQNKWAYVLDENEQKLKLKEIGSISQYPIKLAYALSIHKSQGLTFDEVTVDLSQPCFQKGQMYVALSRVRTPEGLRIITR